MAEVVVVRDKIAWVVERSGFELHLTAAEGDRERLIDLISLLGG